MTIEWRLVGCALVLAFAACAGKESSKAPVAEAHGCDGDLDCDPSEVCIFGLCSSSCAKIADCKNGATCLDTGRGSACVRLQDNACVTTANCPARTRCVAGRCLTDCEAGSGTQCLAGQTCVDGTCMLGVGLPTGDASTGGSAMSSAGAGSPGQTVSGSGGATAPPVCASGSVRCDENWVVRCKEAGETEAEETCAFACQDGACTGLCTPKTLRCDGQQRQRCNDAGDWEAMEMCGSICTPAGCTTSCVEGTRECNGSTVTRCSGGRMIDETTCGFICQEGECSGQCLPGSKRCTEGAASSCGADGVWMPPTDCANACVEGGCSGVCTPGAQRCAGTGAFQQCNENGQWGSNVSCEGQACFLGNCTGMCSPGSVRCATPSTAQACELSGQWGAATACKDQTCVDGRCAGMCAPMQKRCDPSGAPRIQTCTSQGQWLAATNCPNGSCREGACNGDCTPNSKRCDPGNPALFQSCGAQGIWGASQACPANSSCDGQGQCSAPTLNCAPSALSPNWYSDAASGGNPSLDDPRWGTAPIVTFETTFGFNAGGYVLVLDQAAKEIAVSMRMTMGPTEAPTPADYVYFGVTPNISGAPAARRVVIPLLDLRQGEVAKPIASFESSALTDTWQDDTGSWVEHVALWRGGPNDGVSWAVNFKIDLQAASVDVGKPFRIVLAAHAEGSTGDLTTPAQAGTLTDTPGRWALATVDPSMCVARIALQ